MRTLTPTLAAAVGASGRQPAVQLKLADDKEHYTLYRLDAPAKPVDGCAAAVAADGSLVRAALFDNGGAGNADLAVQRITDPAVAGQWTAWTTLLAAGCEASQPLALSLNSGSALRLFYADGPSAAATIKVFESATNGASWTGPSTVFAGASSFFYLASAGNDDLFACRNTAVGVWDVQFFKKSAGVWQAPVTWSLGTLSSMYGIAAAWNGSAYFVALSAWYTAGIAIEAYQFDGAATWTDLNFVVPLDGSNLGFQFRLPSVRLVDGLYRLTYVEHDDGSIDGALYDRYRIARSLDFTHWSAGLPASPQTLTSASGAPFVKAFGYYFVTTPSFTFAWPVYSAGDASRNSDVSAQLLSYEREELLLRAGEVRVVVSNQGGQFSSSPSGGPTGLAKNGTLVLNEGYVTAAGAELVNVATALVEHWYFSRAPGENQLVIAALDQSRWLDNEAPLLLGYKTRSVLWLAIEIAARAGLFQVFWPGTAAMGQVLASFVVQPGQTWRQALQRLVEAYSLEYAVRADGSLVLHDPSEGAASVWTWQNEIESAQLGQTDLAANHVRVFAQNVQAEAWDYTAAEAVSVERYQHVVDRALGSNAQAAIRAGNELLLEQRTGRGGEIHVPINPGLEVLDVVTVVDAAINLNQTYRCHGVSAAMDVLRGTFDMRLDLTGA
ncbi:MAG TPA: hypothetical protein VK457_11895 [Chloroflexota bacterium]|nr:hypothetical protein [Chloroflexota bacterium]